MFTPGYVPERDASTAASSSGAPGAVDPASIPLPTSCTSESMWLEKDSYLDATEVTFSASSTTGSMCSEKSEGDLADASTFVFFLASLDDPALSAAAISSGGPFPLAGSESSAAVACSRDTSPARPAPAHRAHRQVFTPFWRTSKWTARSDASATTARAEQDEGAQLRTPDDIYEEGYPRFRDMVSIVSTPYSTRR